MSDHIEKVEETDSELSDEIQPEHEDVDDERDIIDPSDFPTLSLTLKEARRKYANEEYRRDTVENKIGIVVTVDALLISFGTLFSDLPIFILAGVLAPALVSAGLGLYTIRSRNYKRPGKDIEDFYQYSHYDDPANQQEQLLLDYIDTTKTNKTMNDPKFKRFNICVSLTFVSLFLLLAAPVTSHFGWVDSAIAYLDTKPN